MSERSERVGRPSDAPPTPALAAGVRRGASHNHPSGGPAGPDRLRSGASRGTRRSGCGGPGQGGSAGADPDRASDGEDRRPESFAARHRSARRIRPGASAPSVRSAVSAASQTLAAGPTRGASRSLAPTTTPGAASAARAPCGQGASLLRRCAQVLPLSGRGTASDSTILLCCSGSRSPAAVAPLQRSWAPDRGPRRVAPVDKPSAPSSLRAGLAHIFHNWRRCRRPLTAFMRARSR